jgi:hypothetical protein
MKLSSTIPIVYMYTFLLNKKKRRRRWTRKLIWCACLFRTRNFLNSSVATEWNQDEGPCLLLIPFLSYLDPLY